MWRLRFSFKFILVLFLIIAPIYLCRNAIQTMDLESVIYHFLLNPKIEIEPEDLTYLISIVPSVETIQASDKIEIAIPLIPNFKERSSTSKRIYLYNTHQSETYNDGVSIYEVTVHFAKILQELGFEVVFESSNFLKEAEKEGLKYNQLYTISRRHINEALVNYGGFDLVIDVHRDSCSRSVSYVSENNVDYAKLMFVVGMKSSNASAIMQHAQALTDKMRVKVSAIMREPFERQSVYNQDMMEKMLLLEVGGDHNSSLEAINSLTVFAQVLKEEMQ